MDDKMLLINVGVLIIGIAVGFLIAKAMEKAKGNESIS